MKQAYVLGFRWRMVFGYEPQVALIRKSKPHWQAGLLNGIGGKIEEFAAENYGLDPSDRVTFDEASWTGKTSPAQRAMAREFFEETGVHTKPSEWRHFGELVHNGHSIYLYVSEGDCDIRSTTEEEVDWYYVYNLICRGDVMRNLCWLVPLALDPSNVKARIVDNSPIPDKETHA